MKSTKSGGPASWTLPLTGDQSIAITNRRVLPNGNIEAWVEVRDADGALVRPALVLASPRDPLLLLGGDRLNVAPAVELGIARLLRDPREYDRVLAEATDPGPPLPTVPELSAADETVIRLLSFAHAAGRAEGFALGLAEGLRAGVDDPAPALAPEQSPGQRRRAGREVRRGRI